MLENNGFELIHYSRFIASWNNVNAGKYDKRTDRKAFRAWLKTLSVNGKSLPESVIREIVDLRNNGKFELEELAKKFEYTPEADEGRYIGD